MKSAKRQSKEVIKRSFSWIEPLARMGYVAKGIIYRNGVGSGCLPNLYAVVGLATSNQSRVNLNSREWWRIVTILNLSTRQIVANESSTPGFVGVCQMISRAKAQR